MKTTNKSIKYLKYSLLTLCFSWLISSLNALAEHFYTLQLTLNPALERKLQQQTGLDKVHSMTFSNSDHFLYLGQFSNQQRAQNALTALLQAQMLDIKLYQPLIVEIFRPGNTLPPTESRTQKQSRRKNKKQSPNHSFVPTALRAPKTDAHTTLTPPRPLSSAVASDYRKATRTGATVTTQSNTVQYTGQKTPIYRNQKITMGAKKTKKKAFPPPSFNGTGKALSGQDYIQKGYSILLASFKSRKKYHEFIENHPSGDFYCHQGQENKTGKSLIRVHMAVFEKYTEAKSYLSAAGNFGELQPYITALNNIELHPCQ